MKTRIMQCVLVGKSISNPLNLVIILKLGTIFSKKQLSQRGKFKYINKYSITLTVVWLLGG
jgi:hypothetical protein